MKISRPSVLNRTKPLLVLALVLGAALCLASRVASSGRAATVIVPVAGASPGGPLPAYKADDHGDVGPRAPNSDHRDKDEDGEGCGPTPETPCGEVEGRGRLSTNGQASFEVEVESRRRRVDEVVYRDDAARLGFRSTKVKSLSTFEAPDGQHAVLSGKGTANGRAVTYRIELVDGRSDSFSIALSNAYAAQGRVRGKVEIEACRGSGNHAPVVNTVAEPVVDAGAHVRLDGSGSSDPDGDEITFSWKQILGTPVSLRHKSAPVAIFTAPGNGTALVFELTVSDARSCSVGRISVTVHPAEQSAQVDEMVQRSVTEDPAVMGDFPNGWLVAAASDLTFLPTEDETSRFQLKAPIVEEDLPPGATRTVELQLVGASGLFGSARWVGTIRPLAVTIALDGSRLATGTAYRFGPNRGGSAVSAQTTAGGHATMSVTNRARVTVKVRIGFAAAGL